MKLRVLFSWPWNVFVDVISEFLLVPDFNVVVLDFSVIDILGPRGWCERSVFLVEEFATRQDGYPVFVFEL